jgi:hypothetical protein
MTVSINSVEAMWLIVNFTTLLVTLLALWDTWQARSVVLKLNGRAREIVAAGNVRREVVRLGTQLLLIGIVIPQVFIENEIQMSYGVGLLMAVPVLLLINSLLDTFDRKRVVRIISEEIITERRQSMAKIQAVVDDTHERVVNIEANTVPPAEEP